VIQAADQLPVRRYGNTEFLRATLKESVMAQSSTISFERLTPQIGKITFANPPVNLMLPETVATLRDLVVEMSEDPQVQVVIFTSTPGYFFNHFDLTQAAGFVPAEGSLPANVDLVLRLSKAAMRVAVVRTHASGSRSPLYVCDWVDGCRSWRTFPSGARLRSRDDHQRAVVDRE
jgi:hypothetical protein